MSEAELFQTLRGLIDQGRRQGNRTGRFLVLGSAFIDLLRQNGETLAGALSISAPTATSERGWSNHLKLM